MSPAGPDACPLSRQGGRNRPSHHWGGCSMLRSMTTMLRAALPAAFVLLAPTAEAAEPGPLRIHGVTTVLEMGPIMRAAELMPAGATLLRDGNIGNLWKEEVAPGAAPPPVA